MVNVHPGVRDELYKVASVNMCPNTTGQVNIPFSDPWPAGPRSTNADQPGWSQPFGGIACAVRHWADKNLTIGSDDAQVSMSLMVNGPKPGDESYDQYVSEKKEILASLRRRAHMMTVRHASAALQAGTHRSHSEAVQGHENMVSHLFGTAVVSSRSTPRRTRSTRWRA